MSYSPMIFPHRIPSIVRLHSRALIPALLVVSLVWLSSCSSSTTTDPGSDNSAGAAGRGIFTGTVTDSATHIAVLGAIVTLSPSGKSKQTDASGAVEFDSVAMGITTVTIAKPGYITLTRPVTILNAKTVHANFALLAGSAGNSAIVGWRNVPSGTQKNLQAVCYAGSPALMFAVGFEGTFLRSSDGGNTWSTLPKPSNVDLYCVHFYDALNGVVAGDSGVLLMTKDGGLTWKRAYSYLGNVRSISCPDSTTIELAGFYPGSHTEGILERSTDRGITWTDQGLQFGVDTLYAVAFSDKNIGLTVGKHAYTLTTQSGGEGWNGDRPTYRDINLWSAWAPDNSHVFIVGDSGFISMRNQDQAYQTQMSGVTNSLFSTSFADAGHGVAVGEQGTILVTADTGQTWKNQSTGAIAYHGSAFSDAVHAVIVGDGGIILLSIVQ
ncbi:MAG: YCF48-related protein [Bacteroidota bacterium]|nr:YCF48-related protein [Bacteroidota bacterium]MDP4232143.1 YCF48-related protein [Bacteroidota bacterium]MDP4241149.1 YCF48-related protein [Bacteroidota bacterium]MDP4286541.1 YCF48-related protein [Bacteroidota bacterium]